MEKNGRITGLLNKASGLVDVGQIKFSEGWDRANIRFADVEAHGKADLLYVDKYTGATTVMTNGGQVPNSGSSFSWLARGMLYAPIDRGANIHFANLGGLGRADLIQVVPITNRVGIPIFMGGRCSLLTPRRPGRTSTRALVAVVMAVEMMGP